MATQHVNKDCILFATADWDASCWTNKQHTAYHLSLMGYRVLYIESIGLRAPTFNKKDITRIWQRLKRGFKRPPQVMKNIWVLSPLAIPFKQHWFVVRIVNQGFLNVRIKLFMFAHQFKKPIIWSYHPFIQSAIKGIVRGPLVYHCVDDLSAVPGVDVKKFNLEEENFLSACDTVFVTSMALKNKCLNNNARVYYFSNVVDADHFNAARIAGVLPKDLINIPCPRITYIGVLSDFKIDFELVYQAAQLRPDLQWVFIGSEREGQHSLYVTKLAALNNVHFLGHKSYQQLPEYLRGTDVGVLPTLINDYTKSMFPMKYFEYLAAGVPVVSTPLDFTKEHQAGLEIADNVQGFINAIDAQIYRGKLSDDEVLNYVGDNTWSIRLKKMIDIVEEQK